MADPNSMTTVAAAGKLLASEHADVLCEAVRPMLIGIMEGEVAELVGGERYDRSPERASHRNGYRERPWDTHVGTFEPAIPRLRSGSCFPSYLRPRRRSEQGRYPYLWLDAKVERVRTAGSVRHKSLMVAHGVHVTGRREVMSIDVGPTGSEAFWREFLRGLLARGLSGVRRCVSDAHECLKKVIAQVFGCSWQRCTVHFLRDIHGHVQRSQRQMVAAAIRQVFAAPDAVEVRSRLASVVATLEAAAPKVALLLAAAEDELLAFMRFPCEHWTKLRSTNPLECLRV